MVTKTANLKFDYYNENILKQIISIVDTFSINNLKVDTYEDIQLTSKKEFLTDFENAIKTAKGIKDGTVDTSNFTTLDELMEECKKENESV
jgi:hypothetical protein